MNKEKVKLTLEALAVILALAAIGVGIWQFKAESTEARQAAEARNIREFNRAVWLDQYQTYGDISDALGNIISAVELEDDAARRAAESRFRGLYWGRAIFVEGEEVARQMIRFRALINQHHQRRLTDDQLKQAAAKLGNALKEAARSGEEAARLGGSPQADEQVK